DAGAHVAPASPRPPPERTARTGGWSHSQPTRAAADRGSNRVGVWHHVRAAEPNDGYGHSRALPLAGTSRPDVDRGRRALKDLPLQMVGDAQTVANVLGPRSSGKIVIVPSLCQLLPGGR